MSDLRHPLGGQGIFGAPLAGDQRISDEILLMTCPLYNRLIPGYKPSTRSVLLRYALDMFAETPPTVTAYLILFSMTQSSASGDNALKSRLEKIYVTLTRQLTQGG